MVDGTVSYVFCGSAHPLEQQLHYQTYGAICNGNEAIRKGWNKISYPQRKHLSSGLRNTPGSVQRLALQALTARSWWGSMVRRLRDSYDPTDDVNKYTKDMITCAPAGVAYSRKRTCHRHMVCPSCYFRQRQEVFNRLRPYMAADDRLYTVPLTAFPTDESLAPGPKEIHSLKYMQTQFVRRKFGKRGVMFPSLRLLPGDRTKRYWMACYRAIVIGPAGCHPPEVTELGSQESGQWRDYEATEANLADMLTRGKNSQYPVALTYRQVEISDLRDLVLLQSAARVTHYGFNKQSSKENNDERYNWSGTHWGQPLEVTNVELEAGHPVRRLQLTDADRGACSVEPESTGISGGSVRFEQAEYEGCVNVP